MSLFGLDLPGYKESQMLSRWRNDFSLAYSHEEGANGVNYCVSDVNLLV